MRRIVQAITLTASCVLLLAGPAFAAAYSETSSYDPTPGSPKSGDECTITFSSSGDSDQNKADVKAAKKAFDDAMSGSDDMQKKVKDACSKHSNALTINVKRNDANESIASTARNGSVDVDMGDIEKVGDNLSGKQLDKDKVAKNFLAEVLAHEIDHNRDSGTDDHKDPASDKGNKGKPVEDENAVLQDLNAGVSRNQYSYKDEDGKWKVDFTVDKQKVTLNVSDFQTARSTVAKTQEPEEEILGPSTIRSIPPAPCSSGWVPCYRDVQDGSPPLYLGDADLDGVDDVDPEGPLDNCPGLANPQQADTDFDHRGQGCDTDDDGDAWGGWLENAVSSSDMDALSLPEHWYLAGTCGDGFDNDRDGIVDAADQSCRAFPPSPFVFPEPVPVNDVYPLVLRRDRGSVPEGVDVLPAEAHLNVNVYSAGIETWDTSGVLVVVRGVPGDRDLDGLREIETEVVHLDLVGMSPSLGPVRIGVRLSPPSRGLAEDVNLGGPGDYPAESFFDVFFRVDVPGPSDWTNDLPDRYRALVYAWPPYGETFPRTPAPATVLFDDAHLPVAEILDGVLSARIPDSDLDGGPDYADNCPFLPNPVQEDADADGVGDPCDVCPWVFDPEQEDMDGDGPGDACDADLDGDGFDNLMDCAPESRLAALLPPEAAGVRVARAGGETTVFWGEPAPPPFRSSFDVLSGDLLELRAARGYEPALLECLAGNAWSQYAVDPQPDPSPGRAWFYLLRARNACGVGTYGDSGLLPDPRDELDLDEELPCRR